MMTNKEILRELRADREVCAFARFLGMTRAGLWARLKRQALKDNLYGVWVEFKKGGKDAN